MRKSLFNKESKYIDWLFNQRYQISVTIFAALLPTIISALARIFGADHKGCCCFGYSDSGNDGIHCIFMTYNSAFQAIFIFVALLLLINNMWRTNNMLKSNKELIANYIERNTNRRIRNCNEKNEAFEIVSDITKQFYIMWIVVWLLWLVYYTGDAFVNPITDCGKNQKPETNVIIFHQVFDFLSTVAMFVIYLILNNVTTKIKQRTQDYGIWHGLLILILAFSVWISLILKMDVNAADPQLHSLFMAVFSSMSFVLVLGKLNSNYLQVPPLFLLGMYFYAIAQAFIPFKNNNNLIQAVLPYATFIGKIAVILTLCWIVDKKRLIFFIIHKSAALDETPVLLDELDSEPVEF